MSAIIHYTVVRGDTLFGISKRFGMSVDEVKTLNGLQSNNLSIGQTLKVRSKGTPAPTPTPTPPPNPNPPPNPTPTLNYLDARRGFTPEVVQEAGFRRYFLRVPVAGGGLVLANMRDNLTNSRFMVYPQGIMYAGQSHLLLSEVSITAMGVTPEVARALLYVSEHEGSFDAINSYDKAIFSYGFIQFTGAAAVGGSLNRVMASMEANAPSAFNAVFKRVGIDTDGTGKDSVVTVLDEAGRRLRGDDAWLYIQRNVPIYGAFIQAGFEPALVREQIRAANDLYVQPALNFKMDVSIAGIRITVPRVRDIIQSEGAMTAILAIAINQGVGGMSRILAAAVGNVAVRQGANTLQSLSRLSERAIIQEIADVATDERVLRRAQGALDSGLAFG